MDDAGRCFEGCLNLLKCDPSPTANCGYEALAGIVSTCQTACTGGNQAALNQLSAQANCMGAGSLLSTVGLMCISPEACAMTECEMGQYCSAGQCLTWTCTADSLEGPGNQNRDTATLLTFGAVQHQDLTLCAGDEDWYVIDVPANSSLRLDFGFDHSRGDIDIEIFDGSAEETLLVSKSGTNNERIAVVPFNIERRLYVRTFLYSSNFTNPEEMDNTPNNASNQYSLYVSTDIPSEICQRGSDCGEGDLCTSDGLCTPPPPCLSNEDCFGQCDIPTGQCVECLMNDDCYGEQQCELTSKECVSCLNDTQCDGEYCSPEYTCEECLNDTHCPNGTCNEEGRCIPSACQDAFEPNDDVMMPAMLPLSGTTAMIANGYICGDDDYYQFTTSGGSFYAVLQFVDEEGDLELQLLDSMGTTVSSERSSTDNEYIGIPNLMAGTYTLRVFGSGFVVSTYALEVNLNTTEDVCQSNDECAGTCDLNLSLCLPEGYCDSNRMCSIEEPVCDLTVQRCKPCQSDSFEPNDDSSQSKPALSANGQQLNLCGGSDYFVIEANEGQTIRASISFNNDLGDVDLKLYSSMLDDMGQMGQVASSSGVGDEEMIEYIVMTSGQYFLHVYGFRDVYNEYTLNASVQ
jgi:hypothetical protein